MEDRKIKEISSIDDINENPSEGRGRKIKMNTTLCDLKQVHRTGRGIAASWSSSRFSNNLKPK